MGIYKQHKTIKKKIKDIFTRRTQKVNLKNVTLKFASLSTSGFTSREHCKAKQIKLIKRVFNIKDIFCYTDRD